jgi:hypothetical protein
MKNQHPAGPPVLAGPPPPPTPSRSRVCTLAGCTQPRDRPPPPRPVAPSPRPTNRAPTRVNIAPSRAIRRLGSPAATGDGQSKRPGPPPAPGHHASGAANPFNRWLLCSPPDGRLRLHTNTHTKRKTARERGGEGAKSFSSSTSAKRKQQQQQQQRAR